MAELLVASVVTAIALIGVYDTLKRALDIERRMTVDDGDRAAAQAVCDHLVDVLGRAVNVGDEPAIVCRPPKEGSVGSLECRVGPVGCSAFAATGLCVTRLRYTWGFEEGDEQAGCLLVQALPYAGSANIAPIDDLEELEDEALWEAVMPSAVGRRLARFQVRFKPLAEFHDVEAKWKGSWSGQAGATAILVTVKVGDAEIERLVVPPVNGRIGN